VREEGGRQSRKKKRKLGGVRLRKTGEGIGEKEERDPPSLNAYGTDIKKRGAMLYG